MVSLGAAQSEGDFCEVLAPGLLLGCSDATVSLGSGSKAASRTLDFDDKPDDDDCIVEGQTRVVLELAGGQAEGDKASKPARLLPEDALALLLAAPRQRATQLVAKPVRRVTLVAPSFASQPWRLAAMRAVRGVDARVYQRLQLTGIIDREFGRSRWLFGSGARDWCLRGRWRVLCVEKPTFLREALWNSPQSLPTSVTGNIVPVGT